MKKWLDDFVVFHFPYFMWGFACGGLTGIVVHAWIVHRV